MNTLSMKSGATLTDRLRQVMLADVVVTGAAGVLLALAATPLGDLFDLPVLLLRIAGIALVPWTAFVLFVATRPALPRPGVWTVAVGNLAWTIASLLLVVNDAVEPSAIGITFIIVQALAVAGFATMQILGLHRGA